jgi:hypothetical protein
MKKGQSTEDFWTDEQWRVLEPLSLSQRGELMIRAIFGNYIHDSLATLAQPGKGSAKATKFTD